MPTLCRLKIFEKYSEKSIMPDTYPFFERQDDFLNLDIYDFLKMSKFDFLEDIFFCRTEKSGREIVNAFRTENAKKSIFKNLEMKNKI
jgi:hypothetical protein